MSKDNRATEEIVLVGHDKSPSTLAAYLSLSDRFDTPRSRIMLGFIVFAILLLASTLRFYPWTPTGFYTDDLTNYLTYLDGNFASSLFQTLFMSSAEKYRPFVQALIGALFWLFGSHYTLYFWVIIFWHSLCAFMLFRVCMTVSGRNIWVSLACALVFATFHFGLLQATQIIGFVETVSLFFFLLMLYWTVRLYALEQVDRTFARYCAFVLLAGFAAIHSHERYMPTAPWLTLVLFFAPAMQTLRFVPRVLIAGLPWITIVFNIAYKVFVLHDPIFVGTGGAHMRPEFNQTVDQVRQALFSLFGFNRGPDYLAMHTVIPGERGWWLALAFNVGALILFIAALIKTLRRGSGEKPSVVWALSLFLLILLMLLPPALTIRVEQRWLLLPLGLVFIVIAWCVGRFVGKARLAGSAVALIALANLYAADLQLTRYFPNMYLMDGVRFVTALVRVMPIIPSTGQIAFYPNPDHCRGLGSGNFFRAYGGEKRDVNCVTSLDRAKRPELLAQSAIVLAYDVRAYRMADVTPLLKAISDRDGRLSYDFHDRFHDGRIGSNTPIKTPIGVGAMAFHMDTVIGRQNALVVASGIKYSYDLTIGDAPIALRFSTGMIFPSTSPIRATVRIATRLHPDDEVLFSQLVRPRLGNELTYIDPISLPLDAYRNQPVSISFEVDAPPGAWTGQWVGFAEPRLVEIQP